MSSDALMDAIQHPAYAAGFKYSIHLFVAAMADPQHEFGLDMSPTEAAKMLGTTRSRVSRALAEMGDEGTLTVLEPARGRRRARYGYRFWFDRRPLLAFTMRDANDAIPDAAPERSAAVASLPVNTTETAPLRNARARPEGFLALDLVSKPLIQQSSTPSRSRSKSLSADASVADDKSGASQQEVFEAFCVETMTNWKELSKDRAAVIGRWVKQLRDKGATAVEVHLRAAEARHRWPGVPLTGEMLVKRWAELGEHWEPPITVRPSTHPIDQRLRAVRAMRAAKKEIEEGK